ncbi:transposase [uncultured Methanobrevibacter sp.]|uniref:transposase n=1 Tax=uncultured Methanobrevibacter sp. TaxID=253161 RepID=UPI0025CF2051|nr:transposase [uncultured Methanobrevibacter sp.]
MDQSYFQNAPNLFRTLYKSGMDNILDRTGQKFGISVTGIMGVNLLNMVDEKGKEILKNIVVNPTLDREHIKKELSKNIKSKSEKLKEIEIEQSKNRKNKETTFNKIKQICNTTPKITEQKISITQRITIKESLIDSSVENILNNEKEILLILDNAKIHHAEDVKIASKILNIELMYLPEYSPDLQPIEDLWKIIKSVAYLKDYENLDELIWIVTEEFYNHVSSSSLYGGWIDEFMRN